MNFLEKHRAEEINNIIKYLYMSDGEIKQEQAKIYRKTRREKKIVIICSSVISVFLVLAIVVASVGNHYLNKLNYGDVQGVVSPQLDEEEELDFDEVNIDMTTEKFTEKGNSSSTSSTKEHTTQSSTVKDNEELGAAKVVNLTDNYKGLTTGAEIQEKANEEIKENIEKEDGIWQSSSVYNLLLVGYDAGDAEQVMFSGATLPRSDAIILISINSVKNTVKMVSLSRATYVAIPDHGNKRINTAHAYGGAKTLVDTIELNYKIKVDRYISVDFDGFKAIVDVLNGVSVDMTQVEAAFAFNDDSKEAGKYTLNGSQALRYVRLRKTDSDRTRTGRQRKVLKSIANMAKNMSIAQDLEFMDNVLPYATTNFTKGELISKLSNLQTYLSWTMTQDIIPHQATQLTLKDGKEVLILDWEDTTEYIHSILYSGVQVEKL